jgi:3-oxoacyl-[acyl-carrier-protein] synthase II
MMGEGGFARGHEGEVCVSSIKGALGHLLGGAGAVEAVVSVLALRDGVVPPTLNARDVDAGEFRFDYVRGVKQEREVEVVLSNSFGFGGTNATLCFRKYR